LGLPTKKRGFWWQRYFFRILFTRYFKLITQFRSEQFKAREHRPQGVYTDVHDQGGAERNDEMRSL